MVRTFLVYLLIVTFSGCSSPVSQQSSVDKEGRLTEYIVMGLLTPKYQSFKEGTFNLNQEIHRACNSEEPVLVSYLQDLWVQAMMDFHYLEVFNFGPITTGRSEGTVEGRLKGAIYSLPQVNHEASIDREIDKAFQQQENYKIRGLKNHLLGFDSIEYVLFSRYLSHEQFTSSSRECVYLKYIATDLEQRVNKLTGLWQEQELPFLQSPEVQTNLASTYVNRIAEGITPFVDKIVKDRKLAAALGIPVSETYDCEQGFNCHSLYLEHPHAKMAQESLLVHLQAIEDAFISTSKKQTNSPEESFTFNDYFEQSGLSLKSLNEDLFAGEFTQTWNELPQGEEYIDLFATYSAELGTENKAFSAYQKVQGLTRWLKTGFIVSLNVNLPGSVQGDND